MPTPTAKVTRTEAAQALAEAIRLHQAGQRPQAEPLYRRALEGGPDDLSSLTMFGVLLLETSRYGEAIEIFKRAVRVKETTPGVHRNLAAAYTGAGEFEDAVRCYRRALKLSPADAGTLRAMGFLLLALGKVDEALEAYDKALALAPHDGETLGGKALALIQCGRAPEGWALVKNAPALPGYPHPRMALAFGKSCAAHDQARAGIDLLNKALSRPGLPPTDIRDLRFTLSELLEATGDHAAVIRECAMAHRAAPAPWNPDEFEVFAGMIRDTWSASWCASMPRSRIATDVPVLIVGMPRSGTSLVEQIIDRHPDAAGAGELRDLHHIAMTLHERARCDERYPRAALKLTVPMIESAANQYLATLRKASRKALRITDKTPTNWGYLGLYAQMFPASPAGGGARIIHCTRDPMDTCVSCFTTNFTTGNFYTHDMLHLARYYRVYRAMMDHWKRVLDLPMLDVSYEELTADLEGGVRRILDFLGLPFDERCLSFHESTRRVNTASAEQVKKPVYRTSVGRWKRYGDAVEPLRTALGDLV